MIPPSALSFGVPPAVPLDLFDGLVQADVSVEVVEEFRVAHALKCLFFAMRQKRPYFLFESFFHHAVHSLIDPSVEGRSFPFRGNVQTMEMRHGLTFFPVIEGDTSGHQDSEYAHHSLRVPPVRLFPFDWIQAFDL